MKDKIWEAAYRGGKIDAKCHQNLHHFLKIGPFVDKKSSGGYSESRDYKRDESKDL